MERKKVFFGCIHNGARDLMAEEFLAPPTGDRFETSTKGLETKITPLENSPGRNLNDIMP